MFQVRGYPKRAMAAFVAGSLMISGCASNPFSDAELLSREPEPWWSEEQIELLKMSQESAEIRLLAGGAGAAVGVGLSLAFCDDFVCTLAVTTVFTTLGYAGGAYVASKRELADEEQSEMRNSLAGAESAVAFYQKRVDLAQEVVGHHEERVAALNKQALDDEATRQAYEREYEDLVSDRAQILAFADQVQGDIDFMDEELRIRGDSGEHVTGLTKQKEALVSINADLRAQVAQLDQIIGTIPEPSGSV